MPKLNYVYVVVKTEIKKNPFLFSKKTKKHSGSFSEYLSVVYLYCTKVKLTGKISIEK